MFEKLKQKIKDEIETRKAARKAYKNARNIENRRLTDISVQKKTELRKQRMEKAISAGTASKHRLEKLKEQAAKIKENPVLKALAERAKKEIKRQILGRPARKRRRKRKTKTTRRR